MERSVAVLQSNYIPWKGYFDIIHDVDLFIFYDDRQYTKNDWRNRNLIKTPTGTKWLTIPVGARIDRLICDVEIKDREWPGKHWRLIRDNYESAPHFTRFRPFFEEIYCGRTWDNLAVLNHFLIKTIARDFLDIKTIFADSRDFAVTGHKENRLLSLLREAGATRYVSGPAAKNYLTPARFEEAGIELLWKSYDHYPSYPQFHPPFTHYVSILDLLVQTGPEAANYIWKR